MFVILSAVAGSIRDSAKLRSAYSECDASSRVHIFTFFYALSRLLHIQIRFIKEVVRADGLW